MNPVETKRLYYFTTKRWGLKALWEKRLKVVEYKDVNDPFELHPFDLSSEAARGFWHEQATRFPASQHGLLCFSEDWTSTLMWSQYSDKHTGLCLGFDVPSEMAAPIKYIKHPLRHPADPHKALRDAPADVLESALRFKYAGWRHEREWRLRVRLGEPVDGIHYKSFDTDLHLREVVIGARCSLSVEEFERAVSNPPLDVDIFQAQAAHGAFEICRHLEATPKTVKGFRARLALAKDVFADELPDEEPEAGAEEAP